MILNWNIIGQFVWVTSQVSNEALYNFFISASKITSILIKLEQIIRGNNLPCKLLVQKHRFSFFSFMFLFFYAFYSEVYDGNTELEGRKVKGDNEIFFCWILQRNSFLKRKYVFMPNIVGNFTLNNLHFKN